MYQYLADRVFEALIEKTFAVEGHGAASVDSLTYEEANALRYVAGYVCFKVRKNIVASTNPTKDHLLLCLMDLCDEDESVSQSADWVHAVDRGGLVRVSENTFFLFLRIEIIVRSVFNKEKMDVTVAYSRGAAQQQQSLTVSYRRTTLAKVSITPVSDTSSFTHTGLPWVDENGFGFVWVALCVADGHPNKVCAVDDLISAHSVAVNAMSVPVAPPQAPCGNRATMMCCDVQAIVGGPCSAIHAVLPCDCSTGGHCGDCVCHNCKFFSTLPGKMHFVHDCRCPCGCSSPRPPAPSLLLLLPPPPKEGFA